MFSSAVSESNSTPHTLFHLFIYLLLLCLLSQLRNFPMLNLLSLRKANCRQVEYLFECDEAVDAFPLDAVRVRH